MGLILSLVLGVSSLVIAANADFLLHRARAPFKPSVMTMIYMAISLVLALGVLMLLVDLCWQRAPYELILRGLLALVLSLCVATLSTSVGYQISGLGRRLRGRTFARQAWSVTFVLCAVGLAACSSPKPAPLPPQTRVIDTACTWVKPMTASTADTPETKREIIAYETTRQKNCPPKKPAATQPEKRSTN